MSIITRVLLSCANKNKLVNFWKTLSSSEGLNVFQGIASDGTYDFM